MEALAAVPWLWVVLVIGGALVLGAFIAWGQRRTANMTPRETAVAEEGSRRLYREEERRS